MRILYGVQGTGNGHITRARVMAEAFARRGVQVDYLFSGRPREKYFDMAPFGDFQCCHGLTFATSKGRISMLKTVMQSQLGTLIKDIRGLSLAGYDRVISDFEPVTAWAAKLAKVPSIGISHQASFALPVPRDGEDWRAKLLMRYFAPVDVKLGVHWYHFGQPILPPIIETLATAGPVQKNKVLVYLPFESLDDILALLEPFPDVAFYCYHPDAQYQSLGHVQMRPPSRAGFQADLADAAGVIANGGFELPSEALTLGKKLLLKPLHGQFEQLSNVATLHQLRLAKVMYELSPVVLDNWLSQPAAKPIAYPQVADKLVDWLLNGELSDREPLCRSLWQDVRFPAYSTLSSGELSN